MALTLKPFQCPSCQSLFTSRDTGRQHSQKFPVILPCHHSVCDSCLTAAVKAKINFTCVLCKTAVDLSSGNESIAKLHPDLHALGVLNACKRSPLPTNSLKVKMLSSPEMLQKTSPKGLRETTLKVCNNCNQVEALWQCDECQMNFCNICFDEVHKKKKSRKKHEVKKIFAELYNTLVQSGCPEHKNKTVEFYCEKDDQLTCSHCMLIGAHIGHEVKTLVDKNKLCAEEMKRLLTDASDIEKRLKYTQHLLSELSTEEKIDVSDQIKEVHDHFHNLHSILQTREAALISKLEEIASMQNEPFEKMVFEVSGYQKEIAAIRRDAESVIENPCLAVSAPSLLKKLESFQELPCYLLPVGDNTGKTVKIDLVLDQEFEEQIKKHGSVEYSINPRFHLVPTQELPEKYCMDIPESFVPSDDDSQSVTTANTDPFSEDSLVESPVARSGLQAAFKYQHFNRMQSEAVTVSHIRDPSCFWVQRKCDDRKLTLLAADINRFCHTREASHCKPSSLERGDLYLVQYSNDKKWYRGRVKRILEPGDSYEVQVSGKKNLWLEKEKKIVSNDEQKVEIYYIDFGNSEAVSISKLRDIQPRFLHLPPMAKECSLVDVAPIEEEWSLEAIKSFTKFVHQKQVTMQIYEERNNVYLVDLSQVPDASISSDVPVSVRDALVFQEFAVFPSGRNLTAIPRKAGQQYLPPERLRANADISVIVSHVDSPSHLYVQQISTAAYLSALIFEMSECYSRNDNALLQSIYAPRVGMVCAAQFSVDKQWYRAQVISLPGGAMVEVQYVDFGNREILHHRHIRKLFDRFCKLNIQAIPCKLADVTFNQEKNWSSSAKEWLTAKVSKKQLTLKSTGFDAAENKTEVILYYAEDEFEICINGLLVEAGFASSCGPGSSEAKRRVELPPPVPLFEKKEEPVVPYEPPEEEVVAPPVPLLPSQPLPTLVKKFPETEGRNIEVHVSHVVSPSLFYVRIAGDMEKKLEKLMQEMQKTYNGFESAITDCKIGVAYAVYSDISKHWYRASVLSAVQDDKVKVQFVDYGREEEVPVKNVQKLLEPFTADEEYSVCCELTGIIPAGGSSQWSFAACDAFQELVAPHEVLHLSIKEEMQKDAKSKKVNLPASLFVEEIHLGGALEPTEVIYKNIASELVSRGLALPVRGGSSKSVKSSKTDKNAPVSDTVTLSESPKLRSPVKVVPEPEPVPEIQWKPVIYPQEPKFKGFVTNIGEDGSVQLHVMQEGSSVVEMIKKALQFKYSKPSSEKVLKPPPIGSACIAKFSVDSMWYRAEVIDTYPPDKVKVNFVDYGNNEIVSLNDIRLDIILNTFPKQCMDCAITGIHADASGHWDNDLLNFLHSQLVESIVLVEPVAPPDEKGKLPCHIVASCGISINELLQSMGFAGSSSEETENTRSFKPATELREGDIFPVCITQINSSNIVYLQRLKILEPKSDYEKEYNKEHDAFLDLIKELQDKAESFPVLQEPVPGMACCAKYSYDDNWYRCEVTDLEKDGAIVLYVDYGNTETTSPENLRRLESHMIDFPVQVYFCKIYGMAPGGSDWDPDVKTFLIQKLLRSGLEIFAKVRVPGKISEVDLMVADEGGEMKLAYQELVDLNLVTLDSSV